MQCELFTLPHPLFVIIIFIITITSVVFIDSVILNSRFLVIPVIFFKFLPPMFLEHLQMFLYMPHSHVFPVVISKSVMVTIYDLLSFLYSVSTTKFNFLSFTQCFFSIHSFFHYTSNFKCSQ